VTDQHAPPRWRAVFLPVLLSLVVALAAGLGLAFYVNRALARPSGGGLALGEAAVVRDGAGNEVRVVVRSTTLRRTGCDRLGPEHLKHRYLVADVELTVRKGRWPVDPYDFFYDTSDPVSARSAVGLLGPDCGSDLRVGSLPAGETRTGHVFFDEAPAGEITYQPRGIQDPASWPVD
jgi:hypothetical protein